MFALSVLGCNHENTHMNLPPGIPLPPAPLGIPLPPGPPRWFMKRPRALLALLWSTRLPKPLARASCEKSSFLPVLNPD